MKRYFKQVVSIFLIVCMCSLVACNNIEQSNVSKTENNDKPAAELLIAGSNLAYSADMNVEPEIATDWNFYFKNNVPDRDENILEKNITGTYYCTITDICLDEDMDYFDKKAEGEAVETFVVGAESGRIARYYLSGKAEYESQDKNLSFEECSGIANSTLGSFVEDFDKYKVDTDDEYYGTLMQPDATKRYGTHYCFKFERKIGGVPLNKTGLEITVNTDGEVINFDITSAGVFSGADESALSAALDGLDDSAAIAAKVKKICSAYEEFSYEITGKRLCRLRDGTVGIMYDLVCMVPVGSESIRYPVSLWRPIRDLSAPLE